jgi:hypothetical protein
MLRKVTTTLVVLFELGNRVYAADVNSQAPNRRDLTEQGKQARGAYSRPAPHRHRMHYEDLQHHGDAPGRQRSTQARSAQGRSKSTTHDEED